MSFSNRIMTIGESFHIFDGYAFRNQYFVIPYQVYQFILACMVEIFKEIVEEINLVKFFELQNLKFYIIIAQNREETNLPDVKVNFILFDLQYN